MNIFDKINIYYDDLKFLQFRKQLWRFYAGFSNKVLQIVSSGQFEAITLIFILLNSAMFAIDNPEIDQCLKPKYFNTFDKIFIIFYSIEFILKIIGLGLILEEKSYFRQFENILDFIIILTGWLSHPWIDSCSHCFDENEQYIYGCQAIQSDTINLSALRSLRVLKSLKSLSSIKGLKTILDTLFSSFNMLKDNIIIILFFYSVFAIAGLQLFEGFLKKRCFNSENGIIVQYDGGDPYCITSNDCGQYVLEEEKNLYICGKMIANPTYGTVNFDTIGYSLQQVFQITTLEGWSDTEIALMKTFSPYVVFYFIILVPLGAFILINLSLAIIKSKFSQSQEEKEIQIKNLHGIEGYSIKDFTRWGLFISHHKKNIKQQAQTINFSQLLTINTQQELLEQMLFDRKSPKNQNTLNNFISSISQKTPKNRKKIIKFRNQEINQESKIDKNIEIDENQSNIASLKEPINQIPPQISNFISSFNFNLAHKIKKESLQIVLKQNKLKKSLKRNKQQNKDNVNDVQENKLNNFFFANIMLRYNSNNYQIKSPKNSPIKQLKNDNKKQIKIGPKSPISSIKIKTQQEKINQEEQQALIQKDNFSQIKTINQEEYQTQIKKDPFSLNKIINQQEQQAPIQKQKPKFNLISLLEQQNGIKEVDKQQNIQIDEQQIFQSDTEHFFLQKINQQIQNQNIFDAENYITYQKNIAKSGQQQEIPSKIKILYQQQTQTTDICSPYSNKNISNLTCSLNNNVDNEFNVSFTEELYKQEINEQQQNLFLEEEEFNLLGFDKNKMKNNKNLQQNQKNNQPIKKNFKRKKQKNKTIQNTDVLSSKEIEQIKLGLQSEDEALQLHYQAKFDAKYMIARVLFNYESINHDDVLPRLQINIDKQNQIQQQKMRDNKKFKINYQSLIKSSQIDAQNNNGRKKKQQFQFTKQGHLGIYKTQPKNLLKKYQVVPMVESETSRLIILFDIDDDDYGQNPSNISPLKSKPSPEKPKNDNQQNKSSLFILQQCGTQQSSPEKLNKNTQNTQESQVQKKQINLKCLQTFKQFFFKEPNKKDEQDDKDKENNEIQIWDNLNFQSIDRYFFENEQSIEPSLKEKILNLKQEIQINYNKQMQDQYDLPDDDDGFSLIQSRWSGDDILEKMKIYYKQDAQMASRIERILSKLNLKNSDIAIHQGGHGIMGILFEIVTFLRGIIDSNTYNNILMISVLINTIILALDGLVDQNSETILNQFNFAFTIIFLFDMILKIISYGFFEYIRSGMNVFDIIINFLSLIELILGGSSTSALKSIRVFRIFRVLRVTKLIRSLQYMRIIMQVIGDSIESFAYIFLLLLFFIFIYSLVGKELYSNQFDFVDDQPRQNFQSFYNSVKVVFQIITLENWNDILVCALRTSVNKVLTFSYLISWIFMGNYILLNLFLSSMLDGFENQEVEEDEQETIPKQDQEQNHDYSSEDEGLSPLMKLQKKLRENVEVKTEFIYFQDIPCKESFFIFSKQNFFRKMCYWIVKFEYFETIILTAIIITSLKLVIDTYINFDDPSQESAINISQTCDIVFTYFFAMEALIKIIAYGFILDKNSYLRDSWSILDCFIVISSLIDANVSNINLSAVKILRLLRTLRPLRFISHNLSMKLVVTCLMDSFSGILNVLVVLILIWMMFAILGINLLRDKLYYCKFTTPETLSYSQYDYDREHCLQVEGAQWVSQSMNFDNILRGMISLFVLSTLEGWPDYLILWTDAGDDFDSGPILNNYPYIFLFMVAFIFVGALFLLNLFTGVLFLNYRIVEEQSKNQFLSNDQVSWLKIQQLILKSQPNYQSQKIPSNCIRRKIWYLCESNYLDTLVLTCIILNVLTMTMTYDGSSDEYNLILKYINYFFSTVFTLECVLKNIAYGPKVYLSQGWNKFDFFVVIATILDFVMEQIGTQSIKFLKVGPQLSRIFRVLRVTRLLKLVKSLQELQRLIQTIVYAIPALLNIALLLFLLFFIFAILAQYLFSGLEYEQGEVLSHYTNFKNFQNAIVLLFQCSTGENWHLVMFDCFEAGSHTTSIAFFLVFVLKTQFVMLQLFIMVILQQFEENFLNKDNAYSNFEDYEQNFQKTWVNYTTADGEGQFLNSKLLVEFYLNLPVPLGFDLKQKWKEKEDQLNQIHKDKEQKEKDDIIQKEYQKFRSFLKLQACKKLNLIKITANKHGQINYQSLLFCILKDFLYQDIKTYKDDFPEDSYEYKNIKKEAIKQIEQSEKETMEKIQNLQKQDFQKLFQGIQLDYKINQQNLPSNQYICLYFFTKMALYSWIKYNEIQISKIKSSGHIDNSFTEDELTGREQLIQWQHTNINYSLNQSKEKYFLPPTDVYVDEYIQQNEIEDHLNLDIQIEENNENQLQNNYDWKILQIDTNVDNSMQVIFQAADLETPNPNEPNEKNCQVNRNTSRF